LEQPHSGQEPQTVLQENIHITKWIKPCCKLW